MESIQEQKAYFESQWPILKQALESGGPEAAAECIRGHEDPLERRVLWLFARQGMIGENWKGKDFDAFIEVADLGIAEFLDQAANEGDANLRARRIDGANIISYNLAADLAHCWPGDKRSRKPRHFERGLKAAEDCVRWREELDKPAGPRHMAWWAKGMHEISLGRHADAVVSFERALEFGKRMSAEAGSSVEVGPEGTFATLLSAGYLGIARGIAGSAEGAALCDQAIAAFRAQLAEADKKDDAKFGIDQLETVRSRYLK